MSNTHLQQLLSQLRTQRPVTVVGAAVIDVIADAYAPGAAVTSSSSSKVLTLAAALNIAVTLKRLGIDAFAMLTTGSGVWADIIRNRMAKEDCTAGSTMPKAITLVALVEPDGERTLCLLAALRIGGMPPAGTAGYPRRLWCIFRVIS